MHQIKYQEKNTTQCLYDTKTYILKVKSIRNYTQSSFSLYEKSTKFYKRVLKRKTTNQSEKSKEKIVNYLKRMKKKRLYKRAKIFNLRNQ